MKRNLRYSIAVDEIMDKALTQLAKKEDRTKSAYVYNVIKSNKDVKNEMKKIGGG